MLKLQISRYGPCWKENFCRGCLRSQFNVFVCRWQFNKVMLQFTVKEFTTAGFISNISCCKLILATSDRELYIARLKYVLYKAPKYNSFKLLPKYCTGLSSSLIKFASIRRYISHAMIFTATSLKYWILQTKFMKKNMSLVLENKDYNEYSISRKKWNYIVTGVILHLLLHLFR